MHILALQVAKTCLRCGEDDLSQFNKDKRNLTERSRDGLDIYCKQCRSNYNRLRYLELYDKERKKYCKRVAQRTLNRTKENCAYVNQILSAKACVDCGESDPVVLEFDHIDPETKRDAISRMARKCYTLESIKEEIAKCEVRCSNCHRKRTAKQFGWKKGLAKA